MKIEDLKEKCDEYERIEKRARFYDIAINIVDEHPLEASIIILSVWNNSYFMKNINEQNIFEMKEAIKKSISILDRIKNKEIQKENIDEISDIIKQIYTTLSTASLIKYTGASKVMHLFNRNLFVMWDRAIIKKNGFKNKPDAEDYFNFLKKMQNEIKDIKWDNPNKTLAKAIDEYNYVICHPEKSE